MFYYVVESKFEWKIETEWIIFECFIYDSIVVFLNRVFVFNFYSLVDRERNGEKWK